MKFRVVLVGNGEYKKTLYGCNTRETAFIHYQAIKKQNKVLFPKKFINTKTITPIKYEICVTKVTEEGDTFRALRDDLGKTYTEKQLGDWTILDSDEFLIEETFYIYGLPSKKNRPNISEVVKRLVVGAHKKNMVKQAIIVHNKVIIYNEDQFEMIICKCLADAQRLHHTLAKVCKKQKIKSIIFMGTASPVTISYMYDLIQEKTGWNRLKVKRRTTRP